MVSPFVLSTSSPRSPCRWTGDGAWDVASKIIFTFSPQTCTILRTLGSGDTRWQLRVACLDNCHLGRARERRTLESQKPAHVAEFQLEAVPDEPEPQHVDVLKVIPRFWRQPPAPESFDPAPLALLPLWRMVEAGGIGILELLQNSNYFGAAALNSHHCEISGQMILQLKNTHDLATLRCMTDQKAELARSEPQDSGSALVRISISLTFRAGYLEKVMASTTFTRVCLNFNHSDIQSRNQDIRLPFL